MDVVVSSNRSQRTVPRAIANIKGLSNLSDYDVIMRTECLNRRGHKKENELKLVKCSFLLKKKKRYENFENTIRLFSF